jgi:hypothetical protein
MAVLLRGAGCVATAKSEHLFYERASVPEAAQAGFEETLGCAVLCASDERKNSNIN